MLTDDPSDYLDFIYPGDCVRGMTYLPRGCVDVIVTSPPYNIGVDYSSHDDNMPYAEYLSWLRQVSWGCHRVLKADGSFFLNVGNRPSDDWRAMEVAQAMQREGLDDSFCLQNTIHWIKSIAIPEEDVNVGHYKPVNSERFLSNTHEYIFHFTKTGSVPIAKLAVGVPYKDKGNIGRWRSATEDRRGRGNVWFIPYETVNSQKEHPAAFPVRLPEMCIDLHAANKVQTRMVVMDPFAGRGSTAVAAARSGCNWIGYEKDPEYAKAAQEWAEREKRHTKENNQ